MDHPQDDRIDTDATAEQLAELKLLGVSEADLEGLSCCDAEEWIDELRAQRLGVIDEAAPRR